MKIKNILVLIVSFISVVSCMDPDEFLDVIPTGQVIPTTLEDFDGLLNDYAILRSRGVNLTYMDPDVYHSDVTFTPFSSNLVNVNAYTWQYELYDVTGNDNDYNVGYQYITYMNTILQDVDSAEPGNFQESERNNIKAQALAQRAMELFLTVNEYAHHYDPANPDIPGIGMPLVVDLEVLIGRSTVGEVYEQILRDLTTAINLTTETFPNIQRFANFRPGKASLYALLAEVNLYMGDFEQAKINSDIALSLYDFLYDFKDIEFKDPTNLWSGYTIDDWEFCTTNKEVIWSRYNNFYFSITFPGPQLISPELEALYNQQNDKRWQLFTTQDAGLDVSPYNMFAYFNAERVNGLSTPRLLLTNAEAKARTGDGPGAIQALNTLLEKRLINFTPLTHTDNATTLQLVKNERRKELVGTTLNLFDQKRYHVYGDAVPTYTRTNPLTGETFTLQPGDDGYVVAIPAAVREINPNLN